jgi:hypothetical protein
MGEANFFFGTLPFSPSTILAMLIGTPQKHMKNEVQCCWNKNSPWAHMESKFNELGVVRKLLKYVLTCQNNNNLNTRKNEITKIISNP